MGYQFLRGHRGLHPGGRRGNTLGLTNRPRSEPFVLVTPSVRQSPPLVAVIPFQKKSPPFQASAEESGFAAVKSSL